MPFQATIPEGADVRQAEQVMLEAADYAIGLRRRMSAPGYTQSDEDSVDARSVTDFIRNWDPIVRGLQVAEGGDARTALGAVGTAPTAATHPLYRNAADMSAGAMTVESESYRQRTENLAATHIEIELGGSLFASNGADWRNSSEAQMRALIDTGTSDGSPGDAGFFLPIGQPVAPRPRQARLFVRDLLSVQGTTLASVPYIREYNPTAYELGASAVQEGNAKPEVVLAWENDDAPIRKIAAWVPVTTEILDDAVTLRGFIDTRLAYMLAIREERDILFGDGSSGRLKGITAFTGLQTAGTGAVPETVASAIGKIENVDGEADGMAMNPVKYWTFVSTRQSTQFDGGFGQGAPFGVPSSDIWGLPVVRSRNFAESDGLVGAFRQGATLFDRMRTTIRVGNQHSTYFTENKVAILAEERVGLAVHRPDYFVRCTWS